MKDAAPTMLDTALAFIARGWAPIPIPYRKKAPEIKNWPKLRITPEQAGSYFNGESNIGVITGEPSAGLTDIDLDCQKARDAAPFVLPATEAIFGRSSTPAAHWLYTTATEMTRLAWKDPDPQGKKSCLLELRHNDHQTVFPGSVHQDTGEPITWENGRDGDPAAIDAAELVQHCNRLAAATLLARAFPGEGSRDDFCLALGGFLHRAGFTPRQAQNFIEGVAIAGGSANPAERARKGATIRPGKHVAGFPGLERWVGTKRAEAIAAWFNYKGAAEGPQSQQTGETRTEQHEKEKAPSAATSLVNLATKTYRFGSSDTGEAFAIPLEGPKVVQMLRGGKPSLRSQLAKTYFQLTRRAAPQQALADAFGVLEGMAQEPDPEVLHLRVASHGGATWLDLGDAAGRAVKITSTGWTVEAEAPVLFRRTVLTAALPEPVREGSIDELWPWLNLEPADHPLVLACLIAILHVDIPHPVLSFGGEQGTGKSTAMKVLIKLLDPSPAAAKTPAGYRVLGDGRS